MTIMRMPRLIWVIVKCLWRRLSHEQQYRIRAFAWGASVNAFLLVVLAVIHIATKQDDMLVVTMSFTSANQDVDSFTFIDTASELETIEETLEVPEPLMVEAASGIETLTALPILEPSGAGLPITVATEDSQQVEESRFHGTDASKDPRAEEAEERVAAAGGELEGPVRISLMFDGPDDLDLHLQYEYKFVAMIPRWFHGMTGPAEQNGDRRLIENRLCHIWFGLPRDFYGMLDVDANATHVSARPCENIVLRTAPRKATYRVYVNHFRARGGPLPQRYVVVVKYGDRREVYEGLISPVDGVKQVCEFTYRST